MRTLLLADDSVTTQRVVALTFADGAFRVVTASDGQQAMDSMAGMRPDIVLAGTTLPRTNGYELAEYMRSIAALKDVPVLLLAGAFESVDPARLKASGARGVIEKPLEPTAVISRVKELLGIKDARPTPPAGRLVTTADTPADRRVPHAAAPVTARKPPVSTWDQLRQESGLDADARSVEGGAAGAGRNDYLDTLDAALDSLDQQLAGRHSNTQPGHRNPSPPLGQASGAPDPRSPGRRPSPTGDAAPPNAVFEVDADWFGDDHGQSREQAAHRDMVADAHEVMPARPPETSGIFEVDDEWFAEDEQAREARRHQQQHLAAEMGIHDVELPEKDPGVGAPAPPEGLDFDFGLGDLGPPARTPDAPAAAAAVPPPAPASIPPPPAAVAPSAPPAAIAAVPAPVTLLAPVMPAPPAASPLPLASSSVADDFAALLAFETGDPVPAPQPPAVPAPTAGTVAVAPEITSEMLDQIAQRVADRLNAGTFGSDLRDAMTATIRDTVRAVVADTSERLVRDEIARVKARVERDTQ
ncbi:MAG: response regulator [Vicinamibacterales bacterium]